MLQTNFNVSFSNDGNLLGFGSNTQPGNFMDAVSQPNFSLVGYNQTKCLNLATTILLMLRLTITFGF